MLHPVGDLPAAVYWRRRALVLTLLLSVLGGGGWLGYALLTRPAATTPTAVAASGAALPPPTPVLERVTPAVTTVRLPPRYGRCADAAIAVRVTAPPAVPAGAAATFLLVVANTSTVPCVRSLDRGLQEVTLLDAAGHRIWDSNDCAPLAGSDERTLAPRQPVSFPVAWNGLTSEPTCAAQKAAPAAGSYALRGRLDTVTGPTTPLNLG